MASALLLLLCVVLAVEPGEAVWAARRRPVWLACPGEDGVVSEWLQHDRPLLLPDTRRRLLPNGTLHFTKVVAKSDTGLYRCVRRSSTGPVVSVAVRLQMAGVAHDFTEAPSNVTALAGEVVRMSCQIDSMPKATISWERDGKPLPPDTRYVTSVQGVLYIADTEASDEGDYRCVATNVVIGKKRVSSIGHLSVDLAKQSTAAPQLLPTADVVNASEGDDVALVCAARGLPQPVVRWLAPGTRATLSEARGLALLVLHDVSSVHVGEYVCEDADSQERQTVMLAVWTTPHVYLKQPKQSIPAAKTVRFSCEVSGEPKPELFWFKDGRRLHINGRMKQRGTELVMTTTLSSDSGLYQCVASNVAGEAWAVGQLLVSSPSRLEPPRGLSCHPTPAGPVEVSWDSPPGQNFTAFTVHYLPTEGGEETQQVTVNRTVLISDLQPFTNYTFYIRVYFQRSASEESERVTCHTAEGVPIGAPEVQAEVESATTVKLRWSPPPARLARGRISAYKLQWGPRGAPAYHVEEFPSTVTTHVLTGRLTYLVFI